MDPEELVPLNVAAQRIFRQVYLPFHHPQSSPGADQLNGVASALCSLAPVYALDGSGAPRRLSGEDLAGGLFRGGARELLFLDGRDSIRNLAISSREVERAARALHEALSG